MLSYFVGSGWALIFLALALVCLLGGLFLSFDTRTEKFHLGLLIPAILGIVVFMGLAFWAKTHFRVGVNQRALLKNTIQQELVGVRNSGVQSRPVIGVEVIYWKATRAEAFSISMESGLASAPAKGTNTPLMLNPTFYLDLVDLDLMRIYKDGYTSFEDFVNRYILVQAGNVARSVTKEYSIDEHSTKKDQWAKDFERKLGVYFANDGYGIKVAQGKAVLLWDFKNDEDAKAYDDSNRSKFLVIDRANKLEAANKDAEIALARSKVLSATATSGIASWKLVMAYVGTLTEAEQQTLFKFWEFQPNMEYLRVVGEKIQNKDGSPMPFPPGAGPNLTFDASPK